ncbi:hypothetical protein G7B40_024810 [Aetokthonos hydrillicola Thurmond2011]|jgi:hypothetical protein|uniref:Arc-like DNA binding domain-containing protein n=1 Tax=Aetokthonos hydrillicola Thurmond2011 TaxID=2712845 RepID=A0AAP5IDK8_9CYAN|nr:hypothetical protein [Aetokthonos hydrillicola]MBW4586156.1 hypothetical protein [Aetokthonos hydrillicola CCALA 1050]MDR9897763.1 hypothetical protein [Aetokthonos hydrillicola Thurmond2011]
MPRNLAEGETQMNFRIPEEKKEAFLKKAKENGTSASRLLLEFIDNYLGLAPKSNDEIANIKKKVAELEEFRERTEKILGELAA